MAQRTFSRATRGVSGRPGASPRRPRATRGAARPYLDGVSQPSTGFGRHGTAGRRASRQPRARLASPALDPAEAAGLAAALEEIPSAAWVVWADGRVALANGAGRSASDGVPEIAPPRLWACLDGRDDALRVTRILAPGAPPHYLAVRRRGAEDPAARVAAAASRWALTPGQSRVLALLALGQPNKAIASALGCAEATVEVHVTALLAKSGCASRCQLVSRLWSEPVGSRGRPTAP